MVREVRGFRRAFSLIEMLVVIGILAILIGIGMNTFSGATQKAQRARAQAVVNDVAIALESILQRDGAFPRLIRQNGRSDCEMDAANAYELARGKNMVMGLAYKEAGKETAGADRCGVVTPWAQAVLKSDVNASYGTAVPSGGTVRDHVVHFAVDVDGDGYVEASVGGESVKIRASAVAWCCGRDGKKYNYSEGVRRGCSYSWGVGQVER